MKVGKVSIVLFCAALAAVTAVESVAQRTTRRNLHATSAPAAAAASASDGGLRVIASPGTSEVTVRGYDKPLRSRRETFFVTNNLKDETLRRLYITFTYLDGSGRMLHSESREVECELPPAETRQMNVPSWDVQQNFYFVRSTVPARAAQATPFDVKITVDSIAVAP